MPSQNKCVACGSERQSALPIPHLLQSVLSDGRIRHAPLSKMSCLSCGLVSHLASQADADVRATYDDDYDLGVIQTAADAARAKRYAAAIAELGETGRDGDVLEVGCGAGLVLQELSRRWPGARFVGLEAAPQLARASSDPRIDLRREFVEDLALEADGFSLVYAINVVEHAADPARFLRAIARQLSPGGVAILICPDGTKPNLELLFADHIHSFTDKSLALLARDAGLRIRLQESATRFDDFCVFVLEHDQPSVGACGGDALDAYLELHNLRVVYLERWSSLDGLLLSRLGEAREVFAFGAGEAASLLRAYAPGVWARVQALVVDEPALPTFLRKDVVRWADLPRPSDVALVLATHPRSQAQLFTRLAERGCSVVRWDCEIPR